MNKTAQQTLRQKVQVINVYMQLISIPNVTLCTVKAQLYYMKIIKKCTLGGRESNLIISSDFFLSKETPNYFTVTSYLTLYEYEKQTMGKCTVQ